MIKLTFSMIFLLFVTSIVQSSTDIEPSLKELCDLYTNRIKAGIFDKAIKAMNDCREKNLSKDVIAAIGKCESALPMIKADQVIKICNEINANKDKFIEIFKCYKQSVANNYEIFMECYVAFESSNADSG